MSDARREGHDAPVHRSRGEGGRGDDAIDRAVREMLDVEPPAGLRARVMARIDQPPSVGSAFRRKIWWIGLPLAAAAAILLAVNLPSHHDSPVTTSAGRSGPDIQLPAPAAPRSTPPSSTRTVVARADGRAPRGAAARPGTPQRGTAAAATVAVSADDTPDTIEPLAAIAPIAVAAISSRSIAPATITVTPLSPIAELQVSPLTPPDRRN
jgi:hypothetical protein